MRKVAVLISGNIRIYEKNLHFLKKIFKDFKITIISSVWDHQENIEKFKSLYQIINLKKIKEKNWSDELKKVTYVTGEENRSYKIENIFHMWFSIIQNIKFLKDITEKEKTNFDYVCRFRSDIFEINQSNFLKKELIKLKEREILFPCNNHYRGLNDMFFITKYKTFLHFENMFSFIDNFLKQKRVFNPEYLLYCFVKNNGFKIKLAHNFAIELLGLNTKSHDNYNLKPRKEAFIPFRDRINLKKAKYTIKFLIKKNKLRYLIK